MAMMDGCVCLTVGQGGLHGMSWQWMRVWDDWQWRSQLFLCQYTQSTDSNQIESNWQQGSYYGIWRYGTLTEKKLQIYGKHVLLYMYAIANYDWLDLALATKYPHLLAAKVVCNKL